MENLDKTITGSGVTGIAEKFIKENILNDGNGLADSIYKIDNERFHRFTISIPAKDITGKNAGVETHYCSQEFLAGLSYEIEQAIKEFSCKEENILKVLKDLMDKYMAEDDHDSLSYLIRHFKVAFESTKIQLEEEISKHKEEYEGLVRSLSDLRDVIEKCYTFGFPLFENRRRQQESAIQEYMDMVANIGSETRPTMKRIQLELERKEKAAKLCDSLINLVDSYRICTYEAIFPEEDDTSRKRIKELNAEKEAAQKKLADKQSKLNSLQDRRPSVPGMSTFGFAGNYGNPEDYRKEIAQIQARIKALEKDIADDNATRIDTVYSTVFSPSEVKRKSNMMTQVYLHLQEESGVVISLATASDKKAEVRNFTPLSVKLKHGDKVDIELNIYGSDRLMSERKSLIWQGTFTKCAFRYFIPEDIDVEELYCEIIIIIGHVMIGEMSFTTQIVESPRNLKPEILSHKYNKIFISYAHVDAPIAKALAFAYKVQGIDYFFDRDYLQSGDIYDEKIADYIDSADLFILCWSKNAAESEYVTKERRRALLRAYPQISSKDATLKICPISIPPKAELPADMVEIYNFETIE